MKKHILAMLLALTMVISMVPVTAMAQCNDCQFAPVVPGKIFKTHNQKCEKCGNEFNSGTCTDDGTGSCGECGRQLVHECNQELTKDYGKYHKVGACSICGEGGTKKSHEYSSKYQSVSNAKHAKVCACGSRKSEADHADKDGDGICDANGCVFQMNHECEYVGVNTGVRTHKLVCQCGESTDNVACADYNGDNLCDSCKVAMYDQEEIAPHEHNFVGHPNNDGTHDLSCTCGELVENVRCMDDDGDRYCDSCDYELYKQIVTPPHEHDYVAHSNNDGTHDLSCACGLTSEDVTCVDMDGDRYCDSCNYELYKQVVTPPHEHDYVAHSNNDGTHNLSCTCGLTSENVTCVDMDGDRYCDSCDYELYKQIVTPHEHDYVAHSNNDGTHDLSCTCGLTSENITCADMNGDRYCDSCNYELYKQVVTPPHEHNYVTHTNNDGTHTTSCTCGNSVTVNCLDNNGDNKCDSCGYLKYVHVCEGGKWSSNGDGTHSSKCSCNLVMDGPYPCQSIDGKTCYMCGYALKCNHPEDKLTKDVKQPTCTEGGHLVITCECGEVIKEEKWGALDHMKFEKIEPATCTQEGLLHVVCRRCDELLLEKVLPVRDHVKLDKSFAATCTEDGREHVVCTACDEILLDNIIPAGHKFADGVCTVCGEGCNHENGVEKNLDPTCTEPGIHAFHCPDCGLEKKDEIPALDHEKKDKSYAATCTTDGLEHVVCTRCDEVLRNNVIPATGHVKYVDGKCAACGAKSPVQAETKCNHPDAYLTKDYQAATCTEGGHSVVTCKCGAVVHEEKWGPLEHNYVKGVCSKCGDTDYSTVVPSAPKKTYTWDFQDVYVVGGPAY